MQKLKKQVIKYVTQNKLSQEELLFKLEEAYRDEFLRQQLNNEQWATILGKAWDKSFGLAMQDGHINKKEKFILNRIALIANRYGLNPMATHSFQQHLPKQFKYVQHYTLPEPEPEFSKKYPKYSPKP